MYTKQWTSEQIQQFGAAAASILAALPSTFDVMPTLITDKDGNTIQPKVVKDREDTPKRFAKMLAEMLEGELYTNDEIIEMFKGKVFVQHSSMPIICKWDNIKTFSFCEHHIALMYDLDIGIEVAYDRLKDNKISVIGLSKIPRICDLVCKRLQLQERIATDILYILTKLLELPLTVIIKGKHSCVSARGAKKDITFTTTINNFSSLVNNNIDNTTVNEEGNI